ncbi:NitT/TauT family transport system substrate-binding protein [Arboricoccus pini]|uniref:NitT/TauT family transport system substrate-binding protein n=1 Tax=Arboricoccus pini TaxID=1963835 RepID=A0A212RNY9_9PROT|nr:ABC transporter substrate-binding protein [Arboricoccus pini]SNB74257.1 NitT/TauT family transport system substrate-binding protein [Arboricoccus pini]
MKMNRRLATLALATCMGLGLTVAAKAEVSELRVSKGYGILYLPLHVMQEKKLIEKHAKEAGLGDVTVSWKMLDGGNVINDAMLSGALDIAGTGGPGFITLWSKAKGSSAAVEGVSGMSSTGLWLMSNKPEIKTLADFKEGDKIAIPGIKTSLAAVILQMCVAKEFGQDNYAKLDPLTVGLPHPEAYQALVSGGTEVRAHFASPPFSYLEAASSSVHRVLNHADVLGDMTLDVVYTPKKFADANPKMIEAFIAAQDEANAFIESNKDEAAEILIKASGAKMEKAQALQMLEDKDTNFSTTPKKILDMATFMGEVGSIKRVPTEWSEMFVPQLKDRAGS